MNKQGHSALALLAGSATSIAILSFSPMNLSFGIVGAVLCGATSFLGGLAPDLDHKTSTASQKIQLKARSRRILSILSSGFIVIGLVLMMLGYSFQSVSTWIAAGVIAGCLARLRAIVLVVSGVLMLLGYVSYDWHWIALFTGIALLIMPFVKHRWIIHTPEFAIVLSLGLYIFGQQYSELVMASCLGFIAGWWSHLFGDIFGSEGISSLFFPKLKVALKLFDNGGTAERMISKLCQLGSIMIWVLYLLVFK